MTEISENTKITIGAERTRDLCGPMLRPCEGCGGTADYARAELRGYVEEVADGAETPEGAE